MTFLVHCTKLFLKEVAFVLFNWNVRMELLVHFGGTAQREICVHYIHIWLVESSMVTVLHKANFFPTTKE